MKNSNNLLKVFASVLMILILGFNQPSYGFLNDSQEQQALLAIDNICGDSWCEGEYDYKFQKLDCNADHKLCILDVEAFEWVGFDKKQLVEAKSCLIENVGGIEDIVKNEMLKIKVYEQISDCLYPIIH